MPPLLMTTLISLLLNILAPHSSVTLPHLSKLDNHVAAVSIDWKNR